MNPYIGDRQLEPDDDEFACPWCGTQCGGQHSLMRHVSKCPHNEALDPEPEPED